MYDVIRLVYFDLLFFLLALLCLQESDRSPYGGVNPAFFSLYSKAGQMSDIPQLIVKKKSKMGSGVIFDAPGRNSW